MSNDINPSAKLTRIELPENVALDLARTIAQECVVQNDDESFGFKTKLAANLITQAFAAAMRPEAPTASAVEAATNIDNTCLNLKADVNGAFDREKAAAIIAAHCTAHTDARVKGLLKLLERALPYVGDKCQLKDYDDGAKVLYDEIDAALETNESQKS